MCESRGLVCFAAERSCCDLKVNDLRGSRATYVSGERDWLTWRLSKWPPLDAVTAHKSLGRAMPPMYLEVGIMVSCEKE